jgi:hypothetical protein
VYIGILVVIKNYGSQPLIEMLNDWVTLMKSNGFKGNNGIIFQLLGYRTVETQKN